jgi:hypothetical protein
MKHAGIYKITAPGATYIGSSENIHTRWAVHRSKLLHGTHPNRRLQEAFDHSNPEDLAIEVLERIEDGPTALQKAEERYLQAEWGNPSLCNDVKSGRRARSFQVFYPCGRSLWFDSQREAADRLGVSQVTISLWLRGRIKPGAYYPTAHLKGCRIAYVEA